METRWTLRMALGGAIWGAFLGIPAGALLGVCVGALIGDLSLGLDGAILGGAALLLLGAVYGAFVGWRAAPTSMAAAGSDNPPPHDEFVHGRNPQPILGQGPELGSVPETRHLTL